jgi:hypothetical protein
VEVVEFGWAVWAGGASLMLRPLASEARGRLSRPTSTKWTIGKRTLGASPTWARSGSRRLERRDIRAEIDEHLFCPIEDTVPTIQNLL